MVSIMIGDIAMHNPALKDNTRIVIAPHLRIELNRPDVLTFIMPPNNILFGRIQKRKDTVVVNVDGEEIFRGQVIDERPDLYNMREYTCEGVLSFLTDSIQRPLSITGKENLTAKAHFTNLIAKHNAQVEPEKQFTVGIVNATEKVMQKEETDYENTLSTIEQQLVNRYGGFLRARHENGVNYIDWLKELTDVCTQTVEFGKNIIDLDGLIDSRESGSVLIPLGARQNGKKLTIASVNGGSDSIESADLLAKYGRVVVTKEFPTIKDANELLQKGRETLAKMEDDETFDITAVDLRALGVDVSALRVGLLTPIRAPRLGIDKSKIIYAADMDLKNIENTVYTFGVPRRTLTEALAETARGGGGSAKKIEELSDVITNAYIDIDKLYGEIALRAYQEIVDVRFSEAFIEIDGVNAELRLKADVETVEDMGVRLTEAEILIDGANSEIALKADKTYVDSLFAKSITADTLSASLANLESIKNDSIQGTTGDFETVQAQGVVANVSVETRSLTVNGLSYAAHSHSVSIDTNGQVTLGEVSATGGNFNVADTTFYKNAVSAAYKRGYSAGTAASAGSYNEGYAVGYEAGWVAAAAMATTSRSGQRITVRRPSSIIDTPADDTVYTVSPGGGIDIIRNTAANTFFAEGTCEAYVSVNGGTAVRVSSVKKTKTQTINVGQ